MLLLHDSPLVNGGDAAGPEPVDQRGEMRVAGGRVDIGAVDTRECSVQTKAA